MELQTLVMAHRENTALIGALRVMGSGVSDLSWGRFEIAVAMPWGLKA
jgi:hypothetical protein